MQTQRKTGLTPGAVTFPCPQCSKTTVVRTKEQRIQAIPYTCAECSFEGPN